MKYLTKPMSKRPVETSTSTVTSITPEAREKMIAEKAYELAEQRALREVVSCTTG